MSHLYLSPALQARRGSTHGYDVTGPRRISQDLGGEAAFGELAGAGLAVLLDVVPNHMAASDENPFWADEGLRERFFDIDPETGRHRRFCSIDELAGVRQEDPEVFETTHALVLRLVAEGVVDGLRIDHLDGLADPPEYLRRLADRGAERVWVEKILEPREELPDWPVEGTTGHEFMADATGLFIDPGGEEPLTALYAELTGERRAFAEVAAEAKLSEAFAIRFQQTTGAVMARGVEDTALYRYLRLTALNEVPRALGGLAGRGPRAQRGPRAALPARPPGHPDPRHQALGRRPGPHRRAVVDPGRLARARPALARPQRAVARRRRPGRRRGVPHLPDPRRSLAARAPRGLHGQGDARGQADHRLGRARRGP